jgi:hypothetical protein
MRETDESLRDAVRYSECHCDLFETFQVYRGCRRELWLSLLLAGSKWLWTREQRAPVLFTESQAQQQPRALYISAVGMSVREGSRFHPLHRPFHRDDITTHVTGLKVGIFFSLRMTND